MDTNASLLMDSNLTIILAFGITAMTITIVAVAVVAVQALRRPKDPPSRHTNTTIAVLEDALVNLGQAHNAIKIGREITDAAREGRYNGNLPDAFAEVLQAIELSNQMASFITQLGRSGSYNATMSESEVVQAFREYLAQRGASNGNGQGSEQEDTTVAF